MSRKPETVFIESINRQLPIKRLKMCAKARETHGFSIGYEKMNNPYSSGTADSWYSGNGGDLWVEYKYVPKLPVRVSLKPFELLSELQKEWLRERLEEGRNVAVIVGCPEGGIVLREREWLKEFDPNSIAQHISTKKEIADWILQQTAA